MVKEGVACPDSADIPSSVAVFTDQCEGLPVQTTQLCSTAQVLYPFPTTPSLGSAIDGVARRSCFV